ncbi:hypothetical protein QUA35_12205 [Microcoleus sp. N9_B2]
MSENISLAQTKHSPFKLWDASRPSGVFSQQAGHPTSIILKLCNADRPRFLSISCSIAPDRP